MGSEGIKRFKGVELNVGAGKMSNSPEKLYEDRDEHMSFKKEILKMKEPARKIFENAPNNRRDQALVSTALMLIVKHHGILDFGKEECARLMKAIEPSNCIHREPAVLAALAMFYNEFSNQEKPQDINR